MKTKVLVWIGVFILSALGVNAQENEWQRLPELLQKEAAYFEGQKGYITDLKSKYNSFSLEELSVTDSQIVMAYRMRDRFGNEASEQYLEETVLWQPAFPIVAAEICYNYSFTFESFPEALFLQIRFPEELPFAYHLVSIYKDLKTTKETKSYLTDTTTRIIMPIRRKNREKIFKAIDDYQRKTLMETLKLKGEY